MGCYLPAMPTQTMAIGDSAIAKDGVLRSPHFDLENLETRSDG